MSSNIIIAIMPNENGCGFEMTEEDYVSWMHKEEQLQEMRRMIAEQYESSQADCETIAHLPHSEYCYESGQFGDFIEYCDSSIGTCAMWDEGTDVEPIWQLFPCFHMVCSGICAMGKNCKFLHDQRIRIQDIGVRQSYERTLRRHLNNRPRSNSIDSNDASTVTTESMYHIPCCSDDLFVFPTVDIVASQYRGNWCTYEVVANGDESLQREEEMWYHFLTVLGSEPTRKLNEVKCPRLEVFEKLGNGESVFIITEEMFPPLQATSSLKSKLKLKQ